MQHEGAPLPATPERHEEEERAKSLFDLEKMEPRQVAVLTSALVLAWNAASDKDSPHLPDYDGLINHLVTDLTDAASTSDKALDVYRELVEGDLSTESTMYIATKMIPELLRQNLNDLDRRQWIIDSVVRTLNHGGVAVDAAYEIIGELSGADWLDEDTKHYLEDQLLKFT